MLSPTLLHVLPGDMNARHTTRLGFVPHEMEENPASIKCPGIDSGSEFSSREDYERTCVHGRCRAGVQQAVDGNGHLSSHPSTSLAPRSAVFTALSLQPVSASRAESTHVGNPADVPTYAVPVKKNSSLYHEAMYLPPGTTKRALGRLRIICCCVVTDKSWHAIFVGLPILLITALFGAVVVPSGEWFTYVFTALFTAASIACLTLSVTLDPGVVPPASLSLQPTQPTTVVVEGRTVECKVCTTCHIIRPPRSTHCRSCDVCVEEFDHHCDILGCCVGKRTFRFFGGFFFTTSFLATFIGIRSFIVILSTDFTRANEQSHLIWLAASCTLCVVLAIFGSLLVIPCACRYIKLGATRTTLKEIIRQQHQAQSGEQPSSNVPATLGANNNYCDNISHRFFSPIGRSRIPFDYYV